MGEGSGGNGIGDEVNAAEKKIYDSMKNLYIYKGKCKNCSRVKNKTFPHDPSIKRNTGENKNQTVISQVAAAVV